MTGITELTCQFGKHSYWSAWCKCLRQFTLEKKVFAYGSGDFNSKWGSPSALDLRVVRVPDGNGGENMAEQTAHITSQEAEHTRQRSHKFPVT